MQDNIIAHCLEPHHDGLPLRVERMAACNKGAHGTMTQIQFIEAPLPFDLKGVDCDNRSKFLNPHLLYYFQFQDHPNRISFTCSQPYKKNDNAHLKQKSWTHVRQLFGYDRLDKTVLFELMNDLYRNEWNLLQNHLCSTMKLKEKQRINSKYKRQCHPFRNPLSATDGLRIYRSSDQG